MNVPDSGGFALVLRDFNVFYNLDKLMGYEILECLERNSKRHLLLGERLPTLIYEREVSKDLKVDETKVIGIYSSYENAKKVREEFKLKKGFNRFSVDCFYIDEYELDQDNWIDGFVTWDSADNSWIE